MWVRAHLPVMCSPGLWEEWAGLCHLLLFDIERAWVGITARGTWVSYTFVWYIFVLFFVEHSV